MASRGGWVEVDKNHELLDDAVHTALRSLGCTTTRPKHVLAALRVPVEKISKWTFAQVKRMAGMSEKLTCAVQGHIGNGKGVSFRQTRAPIQNDKKRPCVVVDTLTGGVYATVGYTRNIYGGGAKRIF